MADLAGMRLPQRSPHHRKILRIEVHLPTGDLPGTDHHPVAVILLLIHPELGRLMGDEHLDLHEAARIDQLIDPLPRAELAALVLLVDLLLTAAQQRQGFLRLQLLILLFQDSILPHLVTFRELLSATLNDRLPSSAHWRSFRGTLPPQWSGSEDDPRSSGKRVVSSSQRNEEVQGHKCPLAARSRSRDLPCRRNPTHSPPLAGGD